MDKQERCAFVISQAAALMATVLGMHAENMQRQAVGASMAYDHQAFEDAVVRAGCAHNQVISYLGGY